MTFPKIIYLAPSSRGYLPVDHHFCRTHIRLSRNEPTPGQAPALTYGRYFEAVAEVMSNNDFKALLDAVSIKARREICAADVEEILVYAEKHGSDYHPARIEVIIGGTTTAFVMNVASTERGKERLYREFDVLKHLNSKHGFPFLPRAYFKGETCRDSGEDGKDGNLLVMFLADWFDGYDEFHLSVDTTTGVQGVVVWNRRKGNYYLPRFEAGQVYSQTAKILTLYYDIETFEQIFPWHHAAGDFIIRVRGDSLDVRLVTARQYVPMIDSVPVYEALLFFFLNLTVRMRLDRLDGVGAVAWAGNVCVGATLDGFLEGIRFKERQGIIKVGFLDEFVKYAQSLDKEDIKGRFCALIDACDQAAPDIGVIRKNLERHIQLLWEAIQGIG
ncbi:MAG: hypothetical protein JRD47_00030 [Deltaproteobacteria bacterium]|nr:hypothetical protein [Deltaproteobacteria bacterium]